MTIPPIDAVTPMPQPDAHAAAATVQQQDAFSQLMLMNAQQLMSLGSSGGDPLKDDDES
ncbi:MAG TPA: hypothetical protein VF169_01165 [Albitalea sp.]|uniref:hypothetical protein n=1 Tax=Piscinibacter sp. TaxID=1903157 RepID=UPI002ED2D026